MRGCSLTWSFTTDHVHVHWTMSVSIGKGCSRPHKHMTCCECCTNLENGWIVGARAVSQISCCQGPAPALQVAKRFANNDMVSFAAMYSALPEMTKLLFARIWLLCFRLIFEESWASSSEVSDADLRLGQSHETSSGWRSCAIASIKTARFRALFEVVETVAREHSCTSLGAVIRWLNLDRTLNDVKRFEYIQGGLNRWRRNISGNLIDKSSSCASLSPLGLRPT